MRTVWAAIAISAWISHTTTAKQVGTNFETLTVYVTPADIQQMIQEPYGLLLQIPANQLGRVNHVAVVLDTSGRPGSSFQVYRPNDPQYQNRPLPILAAEFDDQSLRELRDAPLGMLFDVPAGAVSQITHVNLRVARSASTAAQGNGVQPQTQPNNSASQAPSMMQDFGMPSRQPATSTTTPSQNADVRGWNLENQTNSLGTNPSNNGSSLTPNIPSTVGGSMSGGGSFSPSGSQIPLERAPPLRDTTVPTLSDFNSASQQRFGTPSLAPIDPRTSPSWPDRTSAPIDSRYGQPWATGDYRDPFGRANETPPNGSLAYQDSTLTRREMEDRLAFQQMQAFLNHLDRRVSQLTNDWQNEQMRRQTEQQNTGAGGTSSTGLSIPVIQQASTSAPTADRRMTDSSLPRINGFLWFMLLCSIGINLYLAWISRGFYMRYAELADELRETFTSANS